MPPFAHTPPVRKPAGCRPPAAVGLFLRAPAHPANTLTVPRMRVGLAGFLSISALFSMRSFFGPALISADNSPYQGFPCSNFH